MKTPQPPTVRPAQPWMFWVLMAAAAYNLAWGAWTILMPNALFNFANMPEPTYPQLWQCIGMIVGVYGIGYGIAAFDPMRYWPIVLVGFLGKVFGPIGFAQALWLGELPLTFGVTIITNDLIWWVPFGVILWRAFQHESGGLLHDSQHTDAYVKPDLTTASDSEEVAHA